MIFGAEIVAINVAWHYYMCANFEHSLTVHFDSRVKRTSSQNKYNKWVNYVKACILFIIALFYGCIFLLLTQSMRIKNSFEKKWRRCSCVEPSWFIFSIFLRDEMDDFGSPTYEEKQKRLISYLKKNWLFSAAQCGLLWCLVAYSAG